MSKALARAVGADAWPRGAKEVAYEIDAINADALADAGRARGGSCDASQASKLMARAHRNRDVARAKEFVMLDLLPDPLWQAAEGAYVAAEDAWLAASGTGAGNASGGAE